MDLAAVERFSGPPLAERAWVSEQARGCVVRPGTEDLETLVRRDIRGRSDGELTWDSWRRPDGRWTVVAAIGADSPVSTWVYDPRSRSIQPDDAASHRLASEDVVVPLRPTTATVGLPRVHDEAAETPARSQDDGRAQDGARAQDDTGDDAAQSQPEPAEAAADKAPAEASRSKSRKGRRASVPRWDEILFGAGQSDA